jgi:diguanylate cyclase (GGDEF)-like protein
MSEKEPISKGLVPVGNTDLTRTPSTLIGRGLELAIHITSAANKQAQATDRRAVVCISDERLLNLSCIQLTMHGYYTVKARYPAEMLELCKRDDFHLIVTDMGTNALAIAKQIHCEDPTIPAITIKFVGRGVFFQAAPFYVSPWDQPLSFLHRRIAPNDLKDLVNIAGHHFDVVVWRVWSEQYIDKWSTSVLDDLGESARPYLKIVHEEISKIKRNRDHMHTVLRLDALTGVLNRTFFEMRLEAELERAKRFNLQMSLILAEVDSLKSLNDEFGNDICNDVLRSVSITLKQQIRKIDMLCRYSDNDFIIIVPETSVETTLRIAEMLRRAIEAQDSTGLPRKVTISCGVAEYPAHGTTREELVHSVDAALSRAKSSGGNQVSNPKP